MLIQYRSLIVKSTCGIKNDSRRRSVQSLADDKARRSSKSSAQGHYGFKMPRSVSICRVKNMRGRYVSV